MELSAPEKVILEVLTSCSSCGYPRKEFLKDLRSRKIERPMFVIRILYRQRFVRFCKSDGRHRPEGVYKPLRPAYEVLDLT